MLTTWIMAGLTLGPTPPTARQPEPKWQADARIIELTALPTAHGLEVRVVVASDSDDEATAARLEVLLPLGVGILRFDPGCRPSDSPVSSLQARLTCELGTIAVRGQREVHLTTTLPSRSRRNRVAAFVHSDTPDPNPGNNFAVRAIGPDRR